MSVATHCNLRPVILPVNYEAHAQFEVGQSIRSMTYNVYNAPALPYTVTLSFDLERCT